MSDQHRPNPNKFNPRPSNPLYKKTERMTRKKSAAKGLAEKIKNEIVAIVGSGCTLETAAKYSGCRLTDLRREIKHDDNFRDQIERADELAEIYFVRQIKKAAQKEQYWRAAAWALERRRPGRYAARNAETLTVDEIREIFQKLAEIVLGEVTQKEDRKKIIARVEKLLAEAAAENPLAAKRKTSARRKETAEEHDDPQE